MLLNGNISQHFKANSDGFINCYRNGILYFTNRFQENNNFYINLPFSGNYSFSGYGFAMDKQTPLIKKKVNFKLPKPERIRVPIVTEIRIDNASNSPARIATRYGVITTTAKMNEYPAEMRYFILLHEFGHFFYKTEHFCDMFAAYHFLKQGCNPSQSFAALAEVLHPSEANNERIKKIYNLLKK